MRGYVETLGIILTIAPYKEKDRKIYILTPSHGKISAIARGARNLHSPFVGKLRPLNVCKLLIYKSGAEKWTIVQCEVQNTFEDIQRDLEKIAYALEMIESLRFMEETNEKHEIFELFLETLRKLAQEKKKNLILQSFRIKFLDLMGLLPSLMHCRNCHTKIEFHEERKWHPHALTCNNCEKSIKMTEEECFSDRFRKLIQFVKKNTLTEIEKIKLTQHEENTFEKITETLWKETGNPILRSSQVREHLLG